MRPTIANRPLLFLGTALYVVDSLIVALGPLPLRQSTLLALLAGPAAFARVAIVSDVMFFWVVYLLTTVLVGCVFAALIQAGSRFAQILWGIMLLVLWLASGLGGQYFLILLGLTDDLPTDLWPFW